MNHGRGASPMNVATTDDGPRMMDHGTSRQQTELESVVKMTTHRVSQNESDVKL